MVGRAAAAPRRGAAVDLGRWLRCWPVPGAHADVCAALLRDGGKPPPLTPPTCTRALRLRGAGPKCGRSRLPREVSALSRTVLLMTRLAPRALLVRMGRLTLPWTSLGRHAASVEAEEERRHRETRFDNALMINATATQAAWTRRNALIAAGSLVVAVAVALPTLTGQVTSSAPSPSAPSPMPAPDPVAELIRTTNAMNQAALAARRLAYEKEWAGLLPAAGTQRSLVEVKRAAGPAD